MAKVEVSCCHCGRSLHRYPSQIRGQVFCDRKCRKEFHRPSLTCRGCGETFQRDPLQPSRQYCTWECFRLSRHVTLVCVVCGELFDSYLSEVRKRARRGHQACCSRSCRNTYTSLLLGGDGTWVPGGQHKSSTRRGHLWRIVRQQYLETVGGRCGGCYGAEAIEVHHLHPIAAGGDLLAFDNLMAVCRDCHKNMHWQLRHGKFWCSFEGVAHAHWVQG